MIPGQQERANSATVPNPGNYMTKFLLGREYCNKLRASRVEAALQKLESSPHRGQSDTETDSQGGCAICILGYIVRISWANWCKLDLLCVGCREKFFRVSLWKIFHVCKFLLFYFHQLYTSHFLQTTLLREKRKSEQWADKQNRSELDAQR